jgi:glycopeptide antibiotics resistance protein
MLARHPYLSAFAVVYIVGVFAVSLTPGASTRLGFLGGVVLLIPGGVILALLLGNNRLVLALILAVSMCLWLELGRTAWFGSSGTSVNDVIANVIGAVLGVLLTSTFVAVMQRTLKRRREALSPLSQKRQ